ncbi:GeBP transcription factor [Carex littledalei]|uniref:GeBP transcription factor n=1 Tax=Carex littledalei TaxID=544730 RepID=A0A833QDJ2_9POAL|nr:GeBP transcription factor [Carex littledalei]
MPPTSPQKLIRSKPLSDPSFATSPPITSRKSDRKRKSREFPDSAPTFKISSASAGVSHKSWTETEEVALLKAAARFRARTGSPPRTPDMEEFFESVNRSLGSGMDQVRVFYKLKRLKSKFLQANGPLSGPHERLIYKLSEEVWGSDASAKHEKVLEEMPNCEERVEMENGRVNCAFVTEALREYWRENERMNSGALLEEGLQSMDPARAMKLEMKWREQVESDMRLKMKRHEVFKEVYNLLAYAVKNS